jgi:hypothetical protein
MTDGSNSGVDRDLSYGRHRSQAVSKDRAPGTKDRDRGEAAPKTSQGRLAGAGKARSSGTPQPSPGVRGSPDDAAT